VSLQGICSFSHCHHRQIPFPKVFPQKKIILCFIDSASRYICAIKTNLMQNLSSVYFVNQSLHVSVIFVGNHQNQWRTRGGGGFWGFKPPRNSEGPPKSCQTQPILKIADFRTPTPQDVRQKGSKILRLPPVRNCFT